MICDESFPQNSDQLDNLLRVNKVIGEDQNKVEIAFQIMILLMILWHYQINLSLMKVKLNQIYNHLNNAEIDDATKSADLSHTSLDQTDGYSTSSEKVKCCF